MGVDIKAGCIGLNQHRLEPIFRNGKDGSNVGIGWNKYFITLVERAELFVGADNQCQRVEPVTGANRVIYAAVAGEISFKRFNLFSQDIPTRINNPAYRVN